jgi:hypothetical protein
MHGMYHHPNIALNVIISAADGLRIVVLQG